MSPRRIPLLRAAGGRPLIARRYCSGLWEALGILVLAHVNRDACTGLCAPVSDISLARVRVSIATEATLALAVLLIVSVLITAPGA